MKLFLSEDSILSSYLDILTKFLYSERWRHYANIIVISTPIMLDDV